MNLQDVRKLSGTALVLGAVLVLWLMFLGLHDAGLFEWAWPRSALNLMSLQMWMWTGIGTALVLLAALAMLVFGVRTGKDGVAKGGVRQVQCQDCKAVFFMPDSGQRPITHRCPNCRSLGVYTGKEKPIGDPPKPTVEKAKKVVELDLTCQRCKHPFSTTDSGQRPLKIKCPNCAAHGQIN